MSKRHEYAFPVAGHPETMPHQEGMTLREYYAGISLGALLSADSSFDYGEAAGHAVKHADALIKKLEKHDKEET